MKLSKEIEKLDSIFLDTAPVIYYVEAHPQFGPLVKEVVDTFQSICMRGLRAVKRI